MAWCWQAWAALVAVRGGCVGERGGRVEWRMVKQSACKKKKKRNSPREEGLLSSKAGACSDIGLCVEGWRKLEETRREGERLPHDERVSLGEVGV